MNVGFIFVMIDLQKHIANLDACGGFAGGEEGTDRHFSPVCSKVNDL